MLLALWVIEPSSSTNASVVLGQHTATPVYCIQGAFSHCCDCILMVISMVSRWVDFLCDYESVVADSDLMVLMCF